MRNLILILMEGRNRQNSSLKNKIQMLGRVLPRNDTRIAVAHLRKIMGGRGADCRLSGKTDDFL